jgi:hypothetical protein
MIPTVFRIAFVATLAIASPLHVKSLLAPRGAGDSAESQLEIIAPTSNTCAGAAFPDECETASQAAPPLITAMSKYKVYSPPEIAAVLSLIGYETGDFKYAKNHFPAPGRPGQGTRSLMMPNFVLEYALSNPELVSKVQAITTATTTDGLSDTQLNGILDLVLPDQYSWGSAVWFLTTKCASIRSTLQAGGLAGFQAYMGCVGAEATDDRLAYWKRANTAFGLS